jgi:tripartite-type tricarboxylate transporter receptor subunit TctC
MKLNGVARQALDLEDTKQRFAELGMTTRTSSPQELDAYIKSEVAKWAEVIKEANVQALD